MLSSLIVNGQPLTAPSDEPITPWWSFTKTVLAATALSLVRDGLTGLDDPIDAQPFTLRQLLRHEAGLADYGELADYHAAVARGEPAWSPDEMMRRLDGDRLRYTPGTGWGYSNVGYLLIGKLIERLTDRPLDEAVTQRALSPLGVANVYFARTPADLQITHLGNAPNYDPAWVYHGLLIGPISQAVLFLDGLLGADLLPAPLLQEMQTARALGGPIPGRPWATAGYGLGVMQGSIEAGHFVCGHTGRGPGSVIAVYRIREGDASACCAALDASDNQGAVESEVVSTILQALRQQT